MSVIDDSPSATHSALAVQPSSAATLTNSSAPPVPTTPSAHAHEPAISGSSQAGASLNGPASAEAYRRSSGSVMEEAGGRALGSAAGMSGWVKDTLASLINDPTEEEEDLVLGLMGRLKQVLGGHVTVFLKEEEEEELWSVMPDPEGEFRGWLGSV